MGLYLSPGMKTYISLPEQIVNKGWKVHDYSSTDVIFLFHYANYAWALQPQFNKYIIYTVILYTVHI